MKVVERWWRWQPSETMALTWSEVCEYAFHAAMMLKKEKGDG